MRTNTDIRTFIPMAYLLPFIILIEGFASVAVEILTIRQLLPVAGGSVIVTSLIIGIFLLFLAIGYDRGGKAVNVLHHQLRSNFFIASIWIGIGLSYSFIEYFFNVIQKMSGPYITYPLMAYLFVIIAPAIFLLGQTLPITMNIVRQDRMAGAIAGKALGLSTIGSFLGAIFTTLFLMQYLGVAWTVFIVFLLLMLLSTLLHHCKKHFFYALGFALASGAVIYFLNIYLEQKKFILTDNYANYQILNSNNSTLRPDEKILVINEVFSSYTNAQHQAFPYIEAIGKILYDNLQLHSQEILVLGAGGFTLSQSDAGLNHFTYVDIDAQIKKVVVPEFLAEIKDKLVADDARHYLLTHEQKFKAIVIDVFSDYKAIPAYLLTREFMQQIKKHLPTEGGYALFNIIGHPFFNDPYSRRIDNTIRSVFGSCTVTPIQYNKDINNLIYACTNLSRVNDHTIYTDNVNTSTTDSFSW